MYFKNAPPRDARPGGVEHGGYLWTYLRDDRPFGGAGPPIVVYRVEDSRAAERLERHLAGWRGILQCDSYNAHRLLAEVDRPGGPATLAGCWSHLRREFYKLHVEGVLHTATWTVQRMADLGTLEAQIKGHNPQDRLDARRVASTLVVDELMARWENELPRISGKSKLAEAIRYGLSRKAEFRRFLEDGRVDIDNNSVERAIGPQATRESLCIPSSSICKHWKRVFVDYATRATFTGNRRFNRLQRQVFGADLMRRARNHLYCWKRAGFDQASYGVVCDA